VRAIANIKSAAKRAKLAEKRYLRNKSIRSRVKTAIRRFEERLDDPAAREAFFRQAVRQIDKAVTKGVLHKNAAARKKSQLARRLNQVLSS
jgi:small subunit ribosomal protein S20